jgi:hypothetical protein
VKDSLDDPSFVQNQVRAALIGQVLPVPSHSLQQSSLVKAGNGDFRGNTVDSQVSMVESEGEVRESLREVYGCQLDGIWRT